MWKAATTPRRQGVHRRLPDNFYNYPIFQTYIRIPGTTEMMTAWDIHLSEAVTGQVSCQEALDRTKEDWNAIIDDLGREDLLKLYQESIGYTPAQ